MTTDGETRGPAAAPVRTTARQVPSDWIDYNGHMNVAYYTMAFDNAADEVFEDILDIGESYVARENMGPYVLQNHLHYLGELREGERFHVDIRILDHDAKRVHLFMEMFNSADGELAATSEQVLVNVDLGSRRSAPYPEGALAAITAMAAAHAGLARPDQAGRPLGLRRR